MAIYNSPKTQKLTRIAGISRFGCPGFLASCTLHLLVCLFVPPAAVLAQPPPATYAREYRQNFKGSPRDFFFIGPDAAACAKFEPEGLRLKLPAGHHNGMDTGIMTRFGAQGDFEITLKYEILGGPEPSDTGLQTQFSLYIALENQRHHCASINRRLVGGRPDLMTWMFMPGPTPGNADTKTHVFPTQGKTGRLRLTRRGTEISFYATEGEGADPSYRLLQKYAFSNDNVRNVRIMAATGGPKAAVDVRITDLVIRAAALPRLHKIAGAEAKPLTQDAPTYHEPFQGRPQRPEDFVLIGKNAPKHVKFEPNGLRVTLPAGTATWQPTGVATAFGLKGDFEATVRYEILAEPDPANSGSPAVGTRIGLAANVGGINIHHAALMRKLAPFTPAHFVAYQSADKLTDYFSFNAKTGRLRLVRTGDFLAYYLAEGTEKEFKLLTTHPYDVVDLKNIQIFGQASGPNAALDVRFTDFYVRAASLARKSAQSKTEIDGGPQALPNGKVGGDPEIPTKDYAQTYDQSFKRTGATPPGWEFTAPTAEEYVRFEPAGFRLTMPAGWQKERPSAGLRSTFGAKGDFEVTLNFEYLAEPAPTEVGAYATRLLFGIALDTPNFDSAASEVATVNRSLSSKGARSYATWMRNREFPQGLKGGRPATGSTGRLRLVRSGEELYCCASLGADQPFALVKKYRFGHENLKRVSITGATGNEKGMLDVRLTDFRLRADAITGRPSTDAAAHPSSGASPRGEAANFRWIAGLLSALTIAFLGVLAL